MEYGIRMQTAAISLPLAEAHTRDGGPQTVQKTGCRERLFANLRKPRRTGGRYFLAVIGNATRLMVRCIAPCAVST